MVREVCAEMSRELGSATDWFRSNVNLILQCRVIYKAFFEANRIIARVGTASGTNGIIDGLSINKFFAYFDNTEQNLMNCETIYCKDCSFC